MRTKLANLAAVILSLLMLGSLAACTKAQMGAEPGTPLAQSQNATGNRTATQPRSATPSLGSRSGANAGTSPLALTQNNTAITVSGAGTVAAATYANLTFATGGKITELNIQEGDRVSKGTVLARLDTTSLEVALAQAKVALHQAEMAQTQANINFVTAQLTLDKTKTVSDFNDEITNLQWGIKIAETEMPGNPTYWTQHKVITQDSLTEKKEQLSALLGHTANSSAISYVSAQYSGSVIEDVRTKALQAEYAQYAVDKAQGSIDQAAKTLALAQQQLDQAAIIAPFDGLVITINYNVGDIAPTPSQSQRPVIYMIDPVSMVLDIGINELDISEVKVGQPASISINAFPGVKLAGKVTGISQVTAVQGGMVNFNVTITFSVPRNLEVRLGMNGTGQFTKTPSGTTPGPEMTTQSQNASTSRIPAQPRNTAAQGSGSSGSEAASPAIAASSDSQARNVRGVGIITVTTDSNLNFGTGGKIKELKVKEGDKVTPGMVLARLDATSLEAALAQAKVTLEQAELGQTQANVTLKTTQFILDKARTAYNIKRQILDLQWNIKVAEMEMGAPQNSPGTGGPQFSVAQANVTIKKKELTDLLSRPEYSGLLTFDMVGEKYDTLTMEDIRNKELQAEYARQAVDKTQDTIDQARKNLDLARQQLDEATITAPFNGVVATINYNAGDTIPAPTQTQRPVIYLISPTTMELSIGINELDVPSVKVGQPASISIDAFPGVKLEGKVTVIARVPTVQGGIVDYNVKITFSVPRNMEVRAGMHGTAQITVQ